MKKLTRYYIVVLGILITMFGSGIAFASGVTNALYHGIISISNNTSALTNASVNFTLSTPGLIAQGFANSSLSNVAIQNSSGADVAFMPGVNATSPWIVKVPTIGPSQTINSILYTDNATGGKLRYFPDSTGMPITDNASMEPSANFSIETNGFVDTTPAPSEFVFNKVGAIATYMSNKVSGNITTDIGGLHDDFRTDNWTDIGTLINVNTATTKLNYDAQLSAVDNRAYFDPGSIFSDTTWVLDFTITNNTTSGAAPVFCFGLFQTLGNYFGYGADSLFVQLFYNGTNNALYITRTDAGVNATSAGANITNGTTYYVTLQRNSTTLATLYVYSDSARTTQIAGSPVTLAIPATVQNLRYVQASNYNSGAGAGNELIGTVDDVSIDKLPITAIGISAGEHDILTELQPNIIIQTANATFESGIGGWGTSRATAAWDNVIYAQGSYGANVTANDPGGVGASYFSVDVPWNNAYRGMTLTLGMYGRAKSTNILNSRMYAYDGVFNDGANWAKDDTWHWKTLTFTVGMAATSLQIGVNPKYGSTPNTTDVVYVDMVVLLVTSTLPDATNFRMFIDNVYQAGTYVEGVSVPDNSSNWIIGSSATSYLGLPIFKEYVNGVLKCDIENWQYATTFTDSSENGNNGTPSFRTTASNANLTATMASFEPRSQAQASVSNNGTGEVFTSDPTAPSQLYTELDTSKIPGGAVIDALLAASDPSGASRALWWFPFIFIGTIIIGFMTYGATTGGGKALGSLITMCIVCDLSMFTFGIMGVIPLWPAILFWIPAGALTLSQKHWGWG